MQPTFKRKVAKLLDALPGQGHSLRAAYRAIQIARRRRLLERHRRAYPWRLPSPDLIIPLPPQRIELHTNFHPPGEQRELRNSVFGHDVLPGSVLDGDWDLGCRPFTELAAYKSIRDRVERQTPWRQTEYFAESMRDIDAGRPLWNCHNAQELEARLHYVDSLVSSVRTHGLLLQSQVGVQQDPTRRYSDEIEVNIGRDGDFIFQDGRHRLCIAKVLGVPLIPTKIRARHLRWQQFREALFALSEQCRDASGRSMLPQPAPHPDLSDVPANPSAAACLSLLVSDMAGSSMRILDVHAELCFFSHGLEDQAHEIVAIENNVQWLEPARRLKRSCSRHFALHAAVSELEAAPNARFDALLALSAQCTLDSEPDPLLRAALSGTMAARLYTAERPAPSADQPPPLLGWARTHARFEHWIDLGALPDGRHVYRAERAGFGP